MEKDYHGKVNNTALRKLRSRRGMTMAEMIISVLIIIILLGVAFISIIMYQRNLAQKERDAIAKEIFIAAQNHLTMSRGEGYSGIAVAGLGEKETESGSATTGDSKEADTYYIIVSKGDQFSEDGSKMIDAMLPFGSIDETVRAGNSSYVVRYEPETATVLDVFYCSTGTGSRFDYDLKSAGDYYTDILDYRGEEEDKFKARKNYMNGAVLGWYGGGDLERLPYDLDAPKLGLVNGDKLTASVRNSNFTKPNYESNGLQLKLIITGLDSGAKMAVLVDDTNTYKNRLDSTDFSDNRCRLTLDSVTDKNNHFSELVAHANYHGKQFIPGEDIKVEAVAYSKSKLCRIRFSEAKTDNSLFESKLVKDNKTNAFISNFRHLENLDIAVSNVGKVSNAAAAVSQQTAELPKEGAASSMIVSVAKQTDDLEWGKEGSVFHDGCVIYDSQARGTNNYRPVNTELKIEYTGLDHFIKGVTASYSGNAGIFGAPASSSTFSDLELIDCNITAKGNGNNAGTLAGVLSNTKVENVVAYNSAENKYESGGVTSNAAIAGGLIGQVSGGTVTYCSASVRVSGDSAAGGLIGTSAANELTTIDCCYAGGHTDEGEYYEHNNAGERGDAIYNVTADTAAGGLVGNAGNSTITNSYSTCSVDGQSSRSGGFVGIASGSITNCYSLGLVSGKDDNGFIGSGRITGKDSYYLEIVNEYHESFAENPGDKIIVYKDSGSSRVDAMDYSDTTLRKFMGYTKNAAPYDKYLEDHYPGSGDEVKYCYLTVTQLKKNIPNADKLFVNVHHGDWPSPEIFIKNQ